MVQRDLYTAETKKREKLKYTIPVNIRVGALNYAERLTTLHTTINDFHLFMTHL